MSLEKIKTVTLADVSINNKGEYGIGASAVDYSDELYTYLRITDINDDGTLNKNDLKSVDDVDAKNYLLNENDVVFARTGNSTGKAYYYDKMDGELVYAGFLIKFSLDSSKINPKFMKYYVLSKDYKGWVNSMCTGSTRPNINAKMYGNMELILPPREQQDFLVNILGEIDNKIEINKMINKNLEEQLLRIFDSWFLKFELSNEFSDSKLGLIPKGWKIDYLGSKKSCSIIKSGIDEFDNSKIYIATADVDNSIITSNDTLITMDDKPSRANMQPISNSIWFAKMIDSKKLIMVDEYCNDLLNNYIFSTGFCGLKCVDKYFYYLWTFLLTDIFDVMKNNFCTGTTMQAINNKDTKLIEFVLPDDKTITQFNSIAKPMFKKIYYNNLEIKKLQRLRDTLLPKLMSGEIDVSEVNCDLKIIIRKIYIKSSKLFLWRYLSENKNYIKNTKSNETLLKSRTIYKINKFLAKFNARYRYYRQ